MMRSFSAIRKKSVFLIVRAKSAEMMVVAGIVVHVVQACIAWRIFVSRIVCLPVKERPAEAMGVVEVVEVVMGVLSARRMAYVVRFVGNVALSRNA